MRSSPVQSASINVIAPVGQASAQAVVIYPLQRPGAFELPSPAAQQLVAEHHQPLAFFDAQGRELCESDSTPSVPGNSALYTSQ